MNGGGRGAADRNLAHYYHGEVPDRGIRIYVESGMADRLQAQVFAATAGSEGAPEIGGILLGRVERDGDKADAFIEDFVPVECSHTAGPLYILSDGEIFAFEAALLRAALSAAASAAPAVLGYYRSHHREALALGSEDLALIESYFTDPASVFMLVKPARSTKASTAGFFLWEEGRIQSEFSSLELALGQPPAMPRESPASVDASLDEGLPDDVARMFQQAAQAAPAQAAEPAPVAEPPARQTRSPWRGLIIRFAIIVIATLALVVSAIRYLGAPRPGRDERAASAAAGLLGLQVEPQSGGLLVTWDQSAPEILNARRGILSIRDGSRQKSLDLDQSQLDTGSVLYTPLSEDIQFHLEVYNDAGQSAVQSIRVLRSDNR